MNFDFLFKEYTFGLGIMVTYFCIEKLERIFILQQPMKRFQLNSFYIRNKNVLIKTILLQIMLLCYFVDLSAQKEPQLKLKIEAGLNWKPAEKDANLWGQIYGLALKLKTSNKTFIGLRIQANENHQTNEKYKPQQFFIDNNINVILFEATSSTLISFVPTFDYYFSQNSIRPYLGTGVGLYMLTPPLKFLQKSTASGVLETSVNNQAGFLIRGGLDIGKFSVGLEFNYILEADIKIPNGQKIGTVNDSFIALSIGYSFDIGRDRK